MWTGLCGGYLSLAVVPFQLQSGRGLWHQPQVLGSIDFWEERQSWQRWGHWELRENEENKWVFSTQLDPCRHRSVSEAARCVKFQMWFCELTLRAARISHTRRYDHACFLLGLTSRKFRGNRSAFISSPHARHRHFVTWTRAQNLQKVW